MIPNGIIYENGEITNESTFLKNLDKKGYSPKNLTGMLAGRFMPFHQGHFETFKLISKQFNKVHMGIVNPDPWETKLHGDKGRYTLDKNFLTYVERMEMIYGAIDEIGTRSFTTVSPYYPEPFYGKEKFWRYTPGNPDFVINHMAVRDEFDQVKKQRKLGKKRTFVEVPLVVASNGTPYGATMIRKLMLEGEEWRELVPDFTADVIDRYHLVDRLKDIISDSQKQP